MAYATIEKILSQVSSKAPPDPSLFPDFDPGNFSAWAFFLYVYLDSAQGEFDEEGYSTNLWQPGIRPNFLPVYDKSGNSVIQVYLDFAVTSLERYNRLRRMLDYITYCMTIWRTPPEHITYSTRKLGFKISSYDEYDSCFERAKSAAAEAWRRVMYFTARELYPYAFPGERGLDQPNAVASGKSPEEKKTGEEGEGIHHPGYSDSIL